MNKRVLVLIVNFLVSGMASISLYAYLIPNFSSINYITILVPIIATTINYMGQILLKLIEINVSESQKTLFYYYKNSILDGKIYRIDLGFRKEHDGSVIITINLGNSSNSMPKVIGWDRTSRSTNQNEFWIKSTTQTSSFSIDSRKITINMNDDRQIEFTILSDSNNIGSIQASESGKNIESREVKRFDFDLFDWTDNFSLKKNWFSCLTISILSFIIISISMHIFNLVLLSYNVSRDYHVHIVMITGLIAYSMWLFSWPITRLLGRKIIEKLFN